MAATTFSRPTTTTARPTTPKSPGSGQFLSNSFTEQPIQKLGLKPGKIILKTSFSLGRNGSGTECLSSHGLGLHLCFTFLHFSKLGKVNAVLHFSDSSSFSQVSLILNVSRFFSSL